MHMYKHVYYRIVEPPRTQPMEWQRWEMTRFDAPPQPQPELTDASSLAQAQAQTDLEHVQRQAQESGYAQGYADGHAQGLTQGTREGHAEGLRQGKDEGLQAGFQAGLQDGQAAAQQHAQQLQQLADGCAHALHTLEQEVGHALVHLAASIAERVLHSTLTAYPEKMLDIVRDIVHMHGDSDAVLTLRVHPQDHDQVQQYLDQDGALRRWRLVADAAVHAGGCHAETALGAVDATLQTRWRKVLGTLGLDAALHPLSLPTAPTPLTSSTPSTPSTPQDAA